MNRLCRYSTPLLCRVLPDQKSCECDCDFVVHSLTMWLLPLSAPRVIAWATIWSDENDRQGRGYTVVFFLETYAGSECGGGVSCRRHLRVWISPPPSPEGHRCSFHPPLLASPPRRMAIRHLNVSDQVTYLGRYLSAI